MQPGRKRVNPARVRPGAKLFIFDFESRLLWGTYEITTFPHFQRRGRTDFQEDDLPYQMYFQVYRICGPLKEDVFKYAIEENYFTPHKFKFGLNKVQVANLLALFDLARGNYWRKPHQVTQPGKNEKRRLNRAAHKFSGFDKVALSSCMLRGQLARERKHAVQLVIPQIKAPVELMANNSTSQLYQKKRGSLKEELLQCNLKLGRASDSLLMDDSTACTQESVEQDDEDSSINTVSSLEDGEFVLPEDDRSPVRYRQCQELQDLSKTAFDDEIDNDCQTDLRTQNFLENLEQYLTSVKPSTPKSRSSFLTTCDGDTTEPEQFDEASNVPVQVRYINVKEYEGYKRAVRVEDRAEAGDVQEVNSFDKADNQLVEVQNLLGKNIELCKRPVWTDDKGNGLFTRPSQEHPRIPRLDCSTDESKYKTKGSVWLRLANPRPMTADKFFSDVDALEQDKVQGVNHMMSQFNTARGRRQLCPSMQRIIDLDRRYCSATKVFRGKSYFGQTEL